MVVLRVLILITMAIKVISLCKDSIIDREDPLQIQLAQLDSIKCQIEASRLQHQEVMKAITSINSELRPSSTFSWINGIIYFFTSTIFVLIARLIYREIKYLCLMHVDCVADTALNFHSIRDVWNNRNQQYATRDDYRADLKPPLVIGSVRLCARCCNREPSAI